jgi:branched-subunit amino acid aminotransferase/4-amino-4-deoxychorismate lyase
MLYNGSRNDAMKVFLNGRILGEAQARISVQDAGFLYGAGLFETMRSYRGRIFLIREHLRRLADSAKFLGISIPFSEKKLADACHAVLKANKIQEGRVRLTVSRGGLEGPTVTITARTLAAQRSRPFKLIRSGFTVSRNSPTARHKTSSYLPYLLAFEQARKKGADDALLFSEDGILLESSRANIFLVRNGKLSTPSLELPMLPGVTRALVIELAQAQGIKVRQGEFSEQDLLDSEGAFLTNSVMEIAPVKSYGGKPFRSLKAMALIKRLLKLYRQHLS